MKVGLWKIAHARSGDKADRSDIGLFAYDAPTYEVHDPAAYLAPDVVADFTSATFTDLGNDRVQVTGVRGTPATDAEPPECVARIAWRCADQRTAASVGRELVPLALSAPPAGMTGIGRGGSAPNELLGIWPTLVEKTLVDPHVSVVVEEV